MTEPEEEKTKEEELAALRARIDQLQKLEKTTAWETVRLAFAKQLEEKREIILNNATRVEIGGKYIDGMQATQIEAMEKGIIKGIIAVLEFPARYVEQAKEQAEMLQKMLDVKEEDDG